MRIIAGKFRGKKILDPKDLKTRPLKDLTKESIFNIIQHSKKIRFNLQNSEILDLFSGTGSFGIECLSRDVKFVTFVENYVGVLPILKKNLASLKDIDNYKIIERNILYNFDFKIFPNKFDLIFLDPPFQEKELKLILKSIFNTKILKNNGVLIMHRNKKHKDDYPDNFKVIEEKKYGISKITFGKYD